MSTLPGKQLPAKNRGSAGVIALLKDLKRKMADPDGYTIADVWEESSDKFASRPAMHYVGCDLFPAHTLTFLQVEQRANQVANWALETGLKRGDTVALFMENRPEFVITWLGLAKVGVRIALVNSTIKKAPLVHSIKIVNAKMVLFGIELSDSIATVAKQLKEEMKAELVCCGGQAKKEVSGRSLDEELSKQSVLRVSREHRHGIKFGDVFGMIYTSGTTGYPKAVLMTHHRMWSFAINSTAYMTPDDVVYGSGMPLYHGSAGAIGTGMMYLNGCSLVIRRRFSASHWLSDVRKYKVTLFQYIGEICRYIMASDEHPDDGDNTILYATGNGLRPEYWEAFQRRFRIARIQEFYGSTEGNGALRNVVDLTDVVAGNTTAIGCIGRVLKNHQGLRVVRFDIESEELIRDPDTGFLIDCEASEPGEALFPIGGDATSSFTGYTSKEATEKKILRNCFKKGDVYARTGDLLSIDSDKWVRFIDRIGDTFRWRGENVSTTEVSTELAKYPAVEEVNVYGVQVPNSLEGKAGMAALILKDVSPASLDGLLQHANDNLPSYAVPRFLRLLAKQEVTGTFKHQKVGLRNQGINPKLVGDDKLFWLHPTANRYMPFTDVDFAKMSSASTPAKL